jgi:hypothetical protein
MFKVSPASLQIFIETPKCVLRDRVLYSTVRTVLYSTVHIPNIIPNSNYIIRVSD